MNAPIEVTTRYATTVDDLPAAWAFVMAHVDKVGPTPSISISPIWCVGDFSTEERESELKFEVVVSGMVHAD